MFNEHLLESPQKRKIQAEENLQLGFGMSSY